MSLPHKSGFGGVQTGITPFGEGLGASPSYEIILSSLGKGEVNWGVNDFKRQALIHRRITRGHEPIAKRPRPDQSALDIQVPLT